MSGCQQPHFVQAGQLCLQKILSWEGLLIQKCIITVAAFASIVQSVQLRSYLRLTAGLVQKNSEREETIKSMWFFCFSLLGYPHPGSRQFKAVGGWLKEPGLPRDLLTAEGTNHLPCHDSSEQQALPEPFIWAKAQPVPFSARPSRPTEKDIVSWTHYGSVWYPNHPRFWSPRCIA